MEPLTRDRAKPAVPFGGVYRIIDFTLSNCINSGLRRMLVLTQYKAASLDRHIGLGWRFLCRELDEFIDVLPPQQRIDEHWYQGTADAVYQNIYSIEKSRPDLVLILAGDHIYKMDYSEVLQDHIDNHADCTIGCIPVELRESCHFGVMEVDKSQRVVKFLEKPANPDPMPDDPNRCLASMGIYVFNASFLFDQLCRDATVTESSHDFGRDIIPTIIETHRVRAFPFRDRNSGNSRYWRDVGTLDAYYAANMDLVAVEPQLNLYDEAWEIRTYHPPLPPPKFVFGAVRRLKPAGRHGARQHGQSGDDHFRRPRRTVDPLPQRPRQQLGPRGRQHPVRGRQRGPPRQDPSSHHRQGGRRARRGRGRLQPRARPGSRLHRDRHGIVAIGKLQGFVDVREPRISQVDASLR